MAEPQKNETRERILDTAETLFMTRGYKAVRLRDIADAVGMRHASLYYYVPKGKEQLFIAVIERSMARHQREMARLISAAPEDITAQAYAISDWLVSQPPIDMVRMVEADLLEIEPAKAAELSNTIFASLTEPIVRALEKADAKHEISVSDNGMAAMALITLIQGVHHIPLTSIPEGRQSFGRKLTKMLLNGWLAR